MIKHTSSATVHGQFLRDTGTGYPQKTETVTLDGPAPYIYELEEKVSKSSVVSAIIDGSPAEILPWGFAPNPGEIAIHRAKGWIQYNVADDGLDLSVTYDPAGTVYTASKMAAILDTGGITTTVDVDGFTLTFTDGVLTAKDPV